MPVEMIIIHDTKELFASKVSFIGPHYMEAMDLPVLMKSEIK